MGGENGHTEAKQFPRSLNVAGKKAAATGAGNTERFGGALCRFISLLWPRPSEGRQPQDKV